MSNFDFISGIVKDVNAPKTKYQLYEVELGFEKASVLVPYDSSADFEEAAYAEKPKSKVSFLKLASKFGGFSQ